MDTRTEIERAEFLSNKVLEWHSKYIKALEILKDVAGAGGNYCDLIIAHDKAVSFLREEGFK